jgi:glucose-6-phosphate 1-dehydrogenase
MTKITDLQKTEREALLMDRHAIINVVSALRKYRAAAQKLLQGRYRDGACDGVAVSQFAEEIEETEN